MLGVIFVLIVVSLGLFALAVLPFLDQTRMMWQERKEETIAKELDQMFYYEKSPQQIVRLYYVLPFILAIIFYLMTKHAVGSFLGGVVGFVIPSLIIRIRNNSRKRKFEKQILDAIMLLSSSLKGGLSLLQSFEVLAEESMRPMSEEIGLLLRENKMGITLEESLRRLNKRMNTESLTLLVNAVLVARETGGDLTKLFTRLCTTIRDNQKLKENIQTLTLQGKLQGYIMTVLPFLFVAWVLKFDPKHFDIMFQSELGRLLLFLAVALQIVGTFLIQKFSRIRI